MKKKLLIVDDESDIRLTLGSFLSSNNFTVDQAGDGDECLEKLNADKYDCLILDLLMPRMDGYSVIRHISGDVLESMPVIILTAKTDDKDILQGYALGASYYITKPFDNRTVLNAVKYLIGDLNTSQRRKLENTL